MTLFTFEVVWSSLQEPVTRSMRVLARAQNEAEVAVFAFAKEQGVPPDTVTYLYDVVVDLVALTAA